MGRGFYRSGAGSILTAEQLASVLPVPIYRIVTGTAQVVFPNANVSNQSDYVLLVASANAQQKQSSYQHNWVANLPITINWLQWENIAVPVLLDKRVSGWVGVLRSNGTPIYLKNTVINANNQIAVTTSGKKLEAGTYIGEGQMTNQSVSNLLSVDEYLKLVSNLILERAKNQ
jgi:hypothetical protein